MSQLKDTEFAITITYKYRDEWKWEETENWMRTVGIISAVQSQETFSLPFDNPLFGLSYQQLNKTSVFRFYPSVPTVSPCGSPFSQCDGSKGGRTETSFRHGTASLQSSQTLQKTIKLMENQTLTV